MTTNIPRLRSQVWAERAFARVDERLKDNHKSPKYVEFAKRFPSLIHACGLNQALAFALAKNPVLLDDLAWVLGREAEPAGEGLVTTVHRAEVAEYLQLSRDALTAAGWLKRYAEALRPDPVTDDDQSEYAP